ncbi:UdgX family uracil-DNA binding protein [Nocardioides sp. TF02-7]|uniref:UdgX family uracil-DNA binding protein n=1 Tax=Nocardioides sp. TF02-7 TaxID=2917724 RepID=UPI001F05DA1F|nr:UdgX family uracil-DNA binding protein [Nocardioides sp. TF02-7]UMG91523.1 UdgX family uracil-DNA binding protein [Nocardioides sp. TF02-7]
MAEERPGAQQWVPSDPTLADLRSAVQECRGCELYRDATQGVMGEGRPDAPLVLLGEQPGDREDVEGEPFVGPAGKLLDRALGDAGIDPDDVFRTNVVKHFRWKGLRGKRRIHQSPHKAHVEACGPWLDAELRLVRPTGVVLLGGTAGKAVYGSSFKVGETRGRLIEWPDTRPLAHQPAWVLTTTHPSAVLRTDDRDAAYAALVDDLRVAAAQL